MNADDLDRAVATKAGVSIPTARKVIRALGATVVEVLDAGDTARILGLGEFYRSHRAGHAMHMIATGTVEQLPPKSIPRFRFFATIKKHLIKNLPEGTTTTTPTSPNEE